MEMEVEELPTGGEQQPRAPTTTISTISVHSGETRLVIALLQSREWLQLKVLEVHPELTKLGASLKEANELQRAHDDVLLQLQNKQSPVEELLRQADQLISTQKPRAEVYAAMAESLGLAWKDVNSHLEQRKLILDLNVAYQSRAEVCIDRMRALEIACQDSTLPVDIDTVKQFLTKLHDLRKLVLESLMAALQDGKLLLEKLKDLSAEGTLDSRPGHIKTSAEFAVSQVEHWLESLHDRRRLLEIAWQNRKSHLEQCLALALLASDLKGLEEALVVGKEALARCCDHLGNSPASAELLLHEHKKLFPEAKELQDRALKITKATEQLVASGHFAAEQAVAQAYSVLNLSAEYVDAIEQREGLLSRAITFFRSAHTALTKLDQLEVQLTTAKLSASSPQLIQLHSQVSKSIEEITSPPLQEGYSLLEIVGRGSPGIEGVKRTVDEIENRKIYLGELCTAHREENVHLSQAFTTFLEKQNELFSWLVSIAEAFLQGHQDMGSVLAMAKDFLELHHQLLNDLQKKGAEINALLLTLPPILEFLDDEQREDVDQKVDALHSHWLNLKSMLESRIDLADIYVKFHLLAVQLASEFDDAEAEFKKSPDGVDEDTIRLVEQKWLTIQQLYDQLTNVGKNFIEDASKVGDPYLDIKRASLCVETLLEHFGNRQILISESWQTWQTNITVEKEFKVRWEMNITESTRTVDWISKLDVQLYPVLTSNMKSSKAIARELEEKLHTVLSEVKRAQTEIEVRIKATEMLAQKGDTHGQQEVIVDRLMELLKKLQVTTTDYQILSQMLISFFKNLAELEKTIETLQSQYQITRLPSAVSEVELLLKAHEASRQAVLELFKFTQNDAEQIITRIQQQEPPVPAQHDIQRVTVLLEEKHCSWELAWTERKMQLEQHQQLCQFDSDLQLINSSLNDLSTQLSAIRGQYGESSASAKATSLAFVYFEKTIELLQLRIQTFVSTAEQMLLSEHVSSPHIERELRVLQTRWTAFHNQVVESRRLIDLSIEYFKLVEEAEEWFREGSKLLLTIARKSTTVKLPEEATQLLNEVEIFLKPGETRQDERIREISKLAVELYGEERSKQVTLVLNENREMMDSFTVISLELSTLAKNLKAAEEQRERQKKELEEVDASLAAARAEAAAAKAAAAAAEEARKAAEMAAKALQEATPFLQEAKVAYAMPLSPSEPDGEKSRKSPSPPLKKARFIDETPKPVAPVFTVPLHDAAIQEGARFTFECRVTGSPMPEVTWYKDSIAIQNNPDYQTTFDQGVCTLTIEETFTEDSAKFICRAVNAAGTAETNATLSVKEAEPEEQLSPPVFTKRLEPGTSQEGSAFQMECKVEGNPLPTVQWFKNDVCIDNSADYAITYNNGDAVLRLEEVFLEDQAEYCCKATNKLGVDVCSAKLTVEPLEPTEAPSFITPLSNVMARAGQKIKLECEVNGLPTPELSWNHNGKIIQETHDIRMQYDDKKATLVVNEAFPKDAGVYVVSAKNIAGEASSSCNVSVKGRLPTETSDSELASDMEPVKPAIHLSLKDVSIFEGQRVRLDCIIVGQPEPEVIWYHSDRPVKESTDIKLLFQGDRCSLVIEEAYLEDAGEYKVVAINSGGEASSKCNLSVKSVGATDAAVRGQLVEVVQPTGVAPKFSKLLTDILAPEGNKVTFECCVNGDPKPDIKWYLNNEEIHHSDHIQLDHNDEGNVSLTIAEVLPEHKGVYTVKAHNTCGEAKCFASLIVKTISLPEIKHRTAEIQGKHIAPAFQELFADRTVNENDTTKFECVITGKPVPKVEWYFNEAVVSGKNFLVSSSGDRHTLAIFQTSPAHSGVVACVAENEAGKATCVARLCVRTKSPAVLNILPHDSSIVSEHQESSSFTMKRSVIVHSSSSHVTSSVSAANSEPSVQVRSYTSQSEEQFEQIGDNRPVQVQSQKTEEVLQEHQDKPIVHQQTILKVVNGVADHQEAVQATSSTLTYSPKTRKSTAPRFISPLNGKIVDQGADVLLDAVVDGYPQPTVTWHKNGQELSPRDGSVIISWELNHASLEVRNVAVKDAGQYTCKAVNTVGSASSTADVVVKKTIFPPVFGRRLQASVAKAGERVSMNVEVTGTPDPVVTWFKDNQKILGAVPGGPFTTKIHGNSYSLIIEKATPSHSGTYRVKAENAGGKAECIADFVVLEEEPQTEPNLQMMTHVIFKDVREETVQDLPAPTAVTDVTHTTQVYKEEQISNLEPFPFKVEPPQPTVKCIIGAPPPSPSKFVKGEFRESDYESDYDTKIPAKWRPCDSDADEPTYKPVRPVLTPTGRQSHSQASLEVRTPTPPTEFDNPPQFGGPPRPKFEPIEKPSPPVKSETRKPGKPQKVFKPTAVIPKPPSPIELIVATPAVKEPDITLQPGTPPELGYAPPPRRAAAYQNATQMETSKVMKFAESTEHSHRVVSVQQTTRVIKFGDKEKKVPPEPKLEPFPFKPEPECPHPKSGPPPTMPKKFVPGEFRESDYESDYEGARIKPKWAPGDSDTDEPHYRKVRPPPATRSTSVPAKPWDSVPSPMEIDMQPVVLPSLVTVEPKTKSVNALDLESERKTLKRVEELKNRFSKGATSSVQKKTTVTAKGQPSVEESQQVLIKPGEPPEFGFVPASASYVASKHMSEMTDTFKSKAQQFVDDIMTDVKSTKENGHVEKTKAPIPSAETDPQAYREESRVSEYVSPGGSWQGLSPSRGQRSQGRGSTPTPPSTPSTPGSVHGAVGHLTQPRKPPTFITPLRDIAVVSGQNARFECIVQAEPPPNILWSKNGRIIDNSQNYQIQYRNGVCRLTIPQAFPEDAGSYTCTATNMLGTVGTTGSLQVPGIPSHITYGTYRQLQSDLHPPDDWITTVSPLLTDAAESDDIVQEVVVQQSPTQITFGGRPSNVAPPVFEQIFRNARFAQGGNALFEGKVGGIPKPVVSWTRKGAPLIESNKYKMKYDERSGNVSLLISQIGPGDEGEYTCTARNQYGEAICSVFIQPEGAGQLMPQGGYQKEYEQVYQTSEQRISGTQTQSSFQSFQQTSGKTSYTNGHVVEEDFKVDTFEYRLLREVEFRESLTRRYVGETDVQIVTTVDRSLGPVAPPQIAQKPRNSKLAEGSDAIFQAKVTANPKPRLTWFKNGQRIVPSQKYRTSFSNQQATINIANAHAEDSGHYTLLAENPQGCVVSSAYLAIEPAAVQDGFYDSQRASAVKSSQVESVSVVDSSEGKTLAPNFVRVCADRDASEGKMTRFDCRVTGRPYPEVHWFINGRQVSDDATHKILVNESGNHALMITNVSRSDAGVISCVARNKSGETSFQCNLNVIEKEQVVAPKFVERFTTVHVKEGEPVVLNARAVGTPIPRITWQKDGVPIVPGPDVHITIDSGASTLDIPRAKASDAAWYQCTAQNVAGSTATRARLFVETPKGSAPEPRRLNLPRPTRVIEPELAPGPEVIYLRHVERAKPHAPQPEEERIYPPPQFIVPLHDVSQIEGGRVHFEARIEPVGDPTMRVDWFVNGRPLEASSRATTTFRFGFIALDLISIILEDSGEYVCRVTSQSGCVESQALLSVTVRVSIEQSSQHPHSLQYIQQLEDYSRYQRTESVEETSAQRPTFIRPLQQLGELQEGRNAHFEAQLTPVSDPTMKVEWYKDGRHITASSRITTIFNFGYVSLNIMHLRVEDAGTYTVRAVNHLGEAISTSTLTVQARTSVTGDLGFPEQQRYIEKVEELEAYQQQQHYKYVQEVPECTTPPEFKSPIKDQSNIREGAFAHFEARLEPIGDSTLQVEWLKDGRPVEASSRITSFFNFGYVALTIKHVTTHDIGVYTCRAYNRIGQATTSAQLTVVSKKDIILDSQHPGGLEKIHFLEDTSRYGRSVQEETTVTQKPRFLGPLKGTNKIVEGQRAHFEARVEPQNDMTLKIEWYFNGKAIQSANRIQTYHDFGYVAIDILSVRSEDAGTYTIVARNALGEAQLSATMEVEVRSSIDTTSMHRSAVEKTQHLEGSKFVEPQYHIEEISKSKPIFVQPLSDPKPVNEGKNIHLECRLEPMGDPTMRVEWFCNGRPVTVGSRFRTYYDFGYVALDIIHATALDSGEYTVRATNHLGSAHSSACVRVISRSDIVTDSQNEAALEQIQMLEDSSRYRKHVTDDITVVQPPQFTRPLHNLETIEGTNVHLECRLQPVGDPSMRVDWFVNGRPVPTGHRFRPAYDFDYVALDLLGVYPVDSGVYTCQARNQLGEAVTSCSVRVIARKDLILDSQHPSGFEKIQYLEDSSRYKKSEYVDEVVNVKPRFLTKPKSLESMREGQHAHFECKLEPVTDSNLKVEWYKNGRPITVGHRFRPIHDFGYVALDIIDLIAEDSGTYTCRAVNLVGADETTCTLVCRSGAQIVTGTQNESGLEQIQYLEDRSRYQRSEFVEETTKQAPIFTTSLKHIDIKEGQRAHFECRLIPVSDPTMKVEWFHNNVPVKSGSRFTETNNFGFVALDILYCYPEDSGTYTCRAKNIVGEAVTSANLSVHSKQSIYLESQHESALNRISYLEDTSRYQRQTVQEEVITQAPVFTQPMRDIRVAENQAVHFEARLIPVGDPKLKVEWLRNGVSIQASNRVTTMHDFGYVALNMKYVYPEDSGTYTCRATNELGQAVTSSTLVVHSKASLLLESQHEGALEKLHMLEDSSRYHRREEEEIVVTQAPRFTTQLNGPTDLMEAQSAHYECRIEPYPDPNLKVEWFHNGKPLQTGHRFRTTYDFGFAALDILSVYPEDSGEYTCKATNKLGTATSSIKLNVKSRSSVILDTQHEGALQKIQYLEDDSRYKRTKTEDTVIAEKPQFGRPLRNVERLPEGLNVHLEATLTPVNDPTMKVEWYCNGRPIPQGHRFKTTYDFGFVALDILYAYAEDSGTYMCKAKNAVGEAVTTCSVKVEAKAGLYLDTLDEQRLKKIRDLEAYERPSKAEVEPQAQKPVFITPLNSLENLKEGDHAHLECRVEPINDPNLKIEWFVNGIAIKTGHRFRTTHDFGYVALDVLYTYPDDSGTYMAKATNLLGEAVNTCQITVGARRSIYLESQHPEGLAKIRELEAQGRPARLEVEEPVVTPPRFITELRGTTDLFEGQTAHFEAQVEPLHDPNLRIEFYHNGKPLPSASRFHITFDFGYVALDITHVVPEDAGEYTVKAINNLGQCTSSINLRVQAKGNIILESQRPEGLEKIRQLEGATPFQRPEFQEPQTRQRPVFTQPLQNIDAIAEGQTAHFECRLIPVGDPTLKVEWFRNEKPLETSSRITKTHDFGFVALDMTHVRGEDEGVYICRASNALGEAVTTASMKIRTKASIQLDTQHPEGMRKIQQLEEGRAPARRDEPDRVFEKPIFTQLLTGPSELWEGQHAHFECRVVPVGDPTLRFEWFVNGIELKMGSRFHVTHDFGFVTLDIHSVVTADAGVYMCKAVNSAGEAVSSISLKVKSRSSIVGEPLQPDAWQKIQLKEAEMNKVPEMFVDTTPQQAPVFTTHLVSHDKLVEGQHIMLEAQVEPRADPNLRIEWFKNGISLTTGTRIRSTFDFGLVTLTVNGLRPDDSAIYTCKATNLLGEAVSTCTLKIEDRHWLLGGSLRPEALPIIEGLEAPKGGQTEEPEPLFESPVFITHLNNVECKEGDAVHFECRVEPSKDPTLNIEWFVNGKPLPSGARYKSTYDFGYVSLDINHAYAEDSGVYMCKATNSKGQAQTSGTLRCTSKTNIYLDTQHPQGKAGLEKVQEAEDAFLSKYQRQVSGPEATYPKPVFTTPLKPQFSLGEAEPLHLECTVEPKEDPNLKVEWYFNGKALEHGSRFKMTCDFGFVTLHLTDVYERDQGIYTCKAYNLAGEAFTSTTIYCTGKEGLIWHTQHPKGAEGLEKIQDLEESLQRQEGALPEGEEGHPPVFTSQFENLKNLSEGDIAHFEASLTPVGDQTMVVEWFYKGEVLKASHRTRTVHAFGMVVLEILGTKIEDSGTYTCRATNKWGRAEISVELECVEKTKGQKPQFTSHIQSLEGLKDGDSAHFECTLIPVGDPHLKVEWFHNGQPIRHSSRMKSVSDFGFVVMDISYLQSHDSGEYVCRASNRYGEDVTRATIKCAGKGGVYLDTLQPDSLARIRELEVGQGVQRQEPTTPILEPPKFITHISNITQLVEGQSAHFEARLTPVNDPNLTVEWYYNGKKLPHGHRYRTFHDFGIVILDILYCYEENSGEYECRAVNKVGQDLTKATLRCVSKANLILDSQLPRGMEGGLEKIQTLEDSMFHTRDERSTESRGQAPVFTVPLSNIDSLREGENAHFEARLTPTDDPKLKVEWFWNGKPLKTGSRFRTFCDFGFVILEISPVYPEDSGEYSCRAFNDYGQAVTTASMKVQGKRSIILESQLPKGMERTIEKIAELEGLGAVPGQTSPEEDSGKPPEFITTPADLTLTENSLAHFECQLTPVNDSSMRVEWFHNGKPLSAGSRIKTINDFGFVILEVAGVYQRDSGLYTCKATNRHGEATVSCKLQVRGRQGIIMEPQLPTNFRTGTESIQKLEEALYKRDEILSEEEKPDPPRFTVELKDIVDVPEGGAIHFECRVEPVGDSTMRIDWFHNGRPFATGSRVHMLNDFGFVVLDMDYTYARDSGEYLCRATNKWGSATTKATLTCRAKRDIVLESQLPEGMSGEKLKELERGPVSHALPEEAPLSPPKFITQIESVGIGEGEPVHFECRVEPKTDPKLRVEWYRNGKILPTGHRFRTLYDMGFVSLDILYTYPEDSGEYVCRAVNDLGEDTTRATISCKQLPTIILQNQVPKGMKKSEALMQMEATIKKYTSEIFLTEDDLYDVEKKQPPRFVTQIQDQTSLVEMQSSKFECQLAPVGDPHMKVEWFFNGKPLPHKNRFTPIYDFGYVAMNFGWVYPEDSGEYLCRATNLYGMDETRAIIKTAGKPGIIYESQLPKGMKSIERIREMEAAWQVVPEEAVEDLKPKQAPAFVTKPEPFTVTEGEMARFCCRVTGHPKPRVMWVVNGHTVVNGTRYKLTYDGMWHLDIPKTRQYDHGKVEVIARNSAGEAIAVTDLTVKPRQDDYRNVLKNSPRPWYDYELTQYQKERQETELERVFEERSASAQQVEIGEHLGKQKLIKEPETEWQQTLKKKKGEEYYSKLKELEDEQVIKETRLRESSHQFAIPGEKVMHKSLAKGMAQSYEDKLDRKEEIPSSPQLVRHAAEKSFDSQTVTETSETSVDTQKVTRGFPPQPSESAIHGREVHVAKQKQTQKEVSGDVEITRKITATETTEVEHKARTQERVVQGQVKPSKPPFFTKKIQPCRAFEQSQARFEVEFDGDPLPAIKWFREDFPIQSSPDLQIHTFGTKSILIVRQVFMEDSGVFSVVAENKGGSAKCSANLVVEERRRHGRGGVIPPSFLTTVQDTNIAVGQLARFDARVSGTKPLDVYWLKNGKKITSDIRYKTLEEDNVYTLLIIEAFPEDTGKYECVAINSAGEARCDAQLLVQQPSSATPSKTQPSKPATPGTEQAPSVVEPLKGQVIREGQAVAFRCKISGRPVPDIKWLKGDKVIKPSKYFQMQKEGDVYTLRISEAFPEDEGVYKCIATNPAGDVTLSAELRVLAPETQEVPPTLTPMRDVIVSEGSPAQFRTQVSGKPQPTIQWLRDGLVIPQSADFQMIHEGANVVLLIATTYEEDSGTFTCRATNSAGQVERSAQLIVKSKN